MHWWHNCSNSHCCISESIYPSQFQRSHLPRTETARAAAGLLLHCPDNILSESFLWRLTAPQQHWPHLSAPRALFSISVRATFTCIQGDLDFQAVSRNVQWEPSAASPSFSLSAMFPESKYFTPSIQEEITLLFPSDRFHCEWLGQLARPSLSWFWSVSGSLTLLTCPRTSPQYWQSCHQGLTDQSKKETLNRSSISKNLSA